MKEATFLLCENYMLSCMEDSAHDAEHIYRVLYNALDIAHAEEKVDYDVLICACLLHDIGRKEQFENPALCHAEVGAEKAYQFLRNHQFSEVFSQRVKECILTHRYRKNNPPQSLEAKILFDADKIDVAGAIGIARTLIYKGEMTEPIYTKQKDGSISTGENEKTPSFFREYHRKLKHIYTGFLTKRGAEIGKQRQKAAEDFYQHIFNEVNQTYENGKRYIEALIER